MKTDYKMGGITIDIELNDRSQIKEFFHRIHSKLENAVFYIIQKLPENLIPHPLMKWLDRYLDKRIMELKQQTIKQTWRNMYLQDAIDKISKQQQS